MSRLVRLYPPAWRMRYGEELEATLAARPPRLGDQLDLILGAVDAHLHPDLVLAGPDSIASPVPLGHRVPGLIATVGGLTFAAAYVGAGISSDDGWFTWIWVSMLLMLGSLPGLYAGRVARRIGLGLAAIGGSFVLAWTLPWGPNFVPILTIVVLVGSGSLALATVRAGLGRRWRWAAVGLGFGLPAFVLLGVVLGVGWQTDLGRLPPALLVALYGLTWAAVGTVMLVRGSPTFDPEALAARERTA